MIRVIRSDKYTKFVTIPRQIVNQLKLQDGEYIKFTVDDKNKIIMEIIRDE